MSKPIYHIISTGRNCASNIEGFAESIQMQNKADIYVHAVDDYSEDNTWEKLQQITDRRFFVSRSPEHKGAAYWRYHFIKRIEDPLAVIVLVDLDDQLLPNALSYLNSVYANDKTWVTYGNWIDQKGNQNWNICYPEILHENEGWRKIQDKAQIRIRTIKRWTIDRFLPLTYRDENKYIFYPKEVVKANTYRTFPSFLFTHLRTFRRFLFDVFEPYDFQDTKGNWFMTATDVPLIGLLEQCQPHNIHPISRPLYRHNHTYDAELEKQKEKNIEIIRSKRCFIRRHGHIQQILPRLHC